MQSRSSRQVRVQTRKCKMKCRRHGRETRDQALAEVNFAARTLSSGPESIRQKSKTIYLLKLRDRHFSEWRKLEEHFPVEISLPDLHFTNAHHLHLPRRRSGYGLRFNNDIIYTRRHVRDRKCSIIAIEFPLVINSRFHSCRSN